MDRNKPPGQWDDGVREPRVVLSPEPNVELLGRSNRRASDVDSSDHRAPHQGVNAASDEPTLPAPVKVPVSHPRLKNRMLEDAPDKPIPEVDKP